MRAFLMLSLVGFVGLGCKEERKKETPPPLARGSACGHGVECVPGTSCLHEVCMTREDFAARALREEAELQAAATAREQALLRASGVEAAPPAAEVAPVAENAGPGAVRVARTEGKVQVFAACRADERLVGGGCAEKGGGAVSGSYPSHHGVADSIGARWECSRVTVGGYSGTLEAYALCEKVATSPPSPSR